MSRRWARRLAIGSVAAAVLGLAWFAAAITSDANPLLPLPPSEEASGESQAASVPPAPPAPPRTPAEMRAVVRSARSPERHAAAELRASALDSPDPLVAGNALRALGTLKLVAGDRELVALLDDRRPRVRQEVVIALGLSDSPAAVAPLATRLANADETLRPLMIQALSRLPGEQARAVVASIAADPDASATERAFAGADTEAR